MVKTMERRKLMELWARALGLRGPWSEHSDAVGRTPGLRRVSDLTDEATWTKAVCRHREHSPPSMIVLPEGVYEHVCPGCGHVTRFVVRNPRLQVVSVVMDCDPGMNLGFPLGQALGHSA